jgi:hypothetical protein
MTPLTEAAKLARRSSSIAAGESIAQQLLPLLKFAEENCDEPVHFWAGLLSNLAGQMAASIGASAAQVIGDAVASASTKIHQERQGNAH